MSDTVETRLRELVRASSIETREAIFEDLLRELIAVHADMKSVPLIAADGELLGLYVRPAPVGPPTKRTPEQEAEHQRRLATIDDVVGKEEMIRLLTQPVPAGSR
jgi:hypothetical protein